MGMVHNKISLALDVSLHFDRPKNRTQDMSNRGMHRTQGRSTGMRTAGLPFSFQRWT